MYSPRSCSTSPTCINLRSVQPLGLHWLCLYRDVDFIPEVHRCSEVPEDAKWTHKCILNFAVTTRFRITLKFITESLDIKINAD
jgi:hypothetical protein